jgi:choline dehydrogenase-like flavoprotein
MLQQIGQQSEKNIKTDVCIAGAGPAGISLALTLADLGVSSVLLEAGPLGSPDADQRDPYKGESSGIEYPLRRSRFRKFGGTTNVWGGWSKPLDNIDFSRRSTAPLPSWPLSPQDLEPYYPAALEWCEIPDVSFNTADSVPDPDSELLFEDHPEFTTRIFRFSPPTRFGKRYREPVADNEPVNCLYNASLISLEYEGDNIRRAIAGSLSGERPVNCLYNASLISLEYEGDNIRRAIAGSLSGERLEIEAETFVLAMGGIEVARFLLHLAESAGAKFGMESGMVGAGFMDHFGFHPGYMVSRAGLRHHRHTHDSPIMPVLTATEDLQQELDLPSICIIATPDSASEILPGTYFYNPAILGAGAEESERYRLQLICEPTAHLASKVSLGQERDAFGMRRVDLRWEILDQDYERVELFMRQFERAVGQSGVGRVQRTRRFEGEIRRQLSVGWHHMGTTRMADDPRFGVVDTDCRVFGSANLFIASSSVFPRVGYTNPTLAIIALADRLARHINGDAA